MSVLSTNSNLPGMMSEFKDGGLQLRQEAITAQTGSLLILGTATDGPTMEPVAVDASTAEIVFGKSIYPNGKPNGASLPEAFQQAYAEGCRDIRMMRISGKEASSVISAGAISESDPQIQRQTLGTIGGNDAQIFQTSKTPIIKSSVVVKAGGVTLSSSKFDAQDDGEITMKANSTSVGTDITVEYSYYKTKTHAPEDFVAEAAQNEFVLSTAAINVSSVVATVDGVKYAGAKALAVDMKTVTLTDANLLGGEVVSITYTVVTTEKIDVKENKGADGNQWKATAAAKQSFDLAKIPVADSFKLYVNGRDIVDSAAFVVDAEFTPATLKVEKGFFSMGDPIEVAYYYEESASITPTISLSTYFGGKLYNETAREVKDITAEDGTVLGKLLVITKPLAKRSSMDEAPLQYSSIDFPTFGMLVSAINTDIANGVVRADTEYPNFDTATLLASAKQSFDGGDDGLNLTKEQIFKKLSGERDTNGLLINYGAYQILENYQVDYVMPTGVFANDELVGKYDNFAYELALFCAVLSQVHLTHGIIAMKPTVRTGLADIEAYVKQLEAYDNSYFMRQADGTTITDTDGKPFDIGGYISVIAGPELNYSSARLGRYNDVGCNVYAALNSAIRAESASTNKKVASVNGVRYNFGIKQLSRLAAKRYVTFQLRSTDNAVIVTDGVTAAQVNSDYSRLVNIKVVRSVLEEIYKVSQPYIGEPPTAVNNNALSSAISKRLDVKMEGGEIDNYQFQLVVNPLDKLIGDSKLELNIVPPGERRRITVVVGLKKSL